MQKNECWLWDCSANWSCSPTHLELWQKIILIWGYGEKEACNFSNTAVKIRTGNTGWQATPPGIASLFLDYQFSNGIISCIAH